VDPDLRTLHNSLVFVIGTSRSDGNTWLLLNHVNKKVNAKIIDLSKLDISYFDYKYQNIGDDFIKTIEEILEFQTIGFVSPMYWYSVSAQMKTFIDRLSDLLGPRKDLGRRLRGKDSFLLATGNTEEEITAGMEDPIKLTSDYLGMRYRGAFYARIKEDRILNEQILEEVSQFVEGTLAGTD
jgi:multimeric flavodoxin WrbA